MKKLLLGLDMGTTHIKAAICDLYGRQESLSICDSHVIYENEDRSYSSFNPQEIKKSVYHVLSDAISKLQGDYEIMGISVSSMAEAGLAVDKYGTPLTNIITWFDHRTEPQVKWWKENIDDFEIYKRTGLIIHPRCSINKIMWIKENMPEAYKKMAQWLCMEDYVLFILSGVFATDVSIANRTMAMDLRKAEWSDEIITMAGVNKSLFPPISPSGTAVGKVNSETSSCTGLKEGVPVVTGGHDHLCASLSSAVAHDGDMFDSMGTAESFVLINDIIDDEMISNLYKSGFSIGNYVVQGQYYIMGGLLSSGGSIEWFCNNFINCNKNEVNPYERLDELAEKMQEGPSGILYLPHINGGSAPHPDAESKGAFIGIKSGHSTSDILKSIYEGISFESRNMKETLEQIVKKEIRNFKVNGGSTRNKTWMKTKANVLGTNIEIPCIEEPAASGAALLAGIGAGVYENIDSMVKLLSIKSRIVEYDMAVAEKYDYIYNLGYKNLYSTLQPINQVLNSNI